MNDKVILKPDGILHIIIIGKQTDEEVHGSSAISDCLIREHNLEKIRYLVDFSQAGSITPSARQALKERMRVMEYHGSIKYAIIGVSPAVSALIQLYIKATKTKSQVRFFSNEQEAVGWLKSSK